MQEKVNEILEVVDQVGLYIADKLQVPTEVALEVIMKQCQYDLVMGVVWILIPLVLFVIGLFLLKPIVLNQLKNPKDRGCLSDSQFAFIVIYVIYTALSLVSLFINAKTYLPIIMQILINPKWHAATKLIELVK